ncbi:alkaline phosphatase family protein [Actinomycetaceae bacterium WB03_NA08]|uniref:Alkaline phosphatase family protein n=1 Tax=Scrofimicrobium canadense TaxID=2652290 RepID=A0A6N7VSR9_9ACTO|nr:alkaline phosphatase family protein [Scrofimicrobium canadense]MSS84834.1 alkaline phosphatase family protein [Scrofimicrobium canadense]
MSPFSVPESPTTPWIGEVMPSAAAACGVPASGTNTLGVPHGRSAIVIVVDGLGWLNLQEWKGYAPTLRGFLDQSDPIKSCLPSTTAAALTSITTSALPGSSRMMGYSVAHEGKAMNLLHFDRADASTWQPQPTIFQRLIDTELRPVVVSARKFASSGLTLASMRGAVFMGADPLTDRFARARKAVTQQPSLVYLYWSEIDHAGHAHGVGSEEWLHELEAFDRELGRFLSQLPAETSVVLIADHGMINVVDRIDLAAHDELSNGVQLIAGEGRCVHIHTDTDQDNAVLTRWRDFLGERAYIASPDEYPNIFGPGDGNSLLGAGVAFLQDMSVIVDSRAQSPQSIAQVGVHGSDSPAEVLVPFLTLTD